MVVMNPPFGTQDGSRGADRAFLGVAAEIAVASCSIHNADSEAITVGNEPLGGPSFDTFHGAW
jgi:predicted RNA methylase